MSKHKKPRQSLDLAPIRPKTKSQEKVFQAFETGKNVVLAGCAGTGKTFLALYLALDEVLTRGSDYRSIKIFRSAVQSRDQGFLKGSLEEKFGVYEDPYIGLVNELCECGTAYSQLKSKKQIEFISTSFNRGITINNAIIVVDEAQNMTDREISTIVTRMGENTRILLCGDLHQLDLKDWRGEKSGFANMIGIAQSMNEDFDVVRFSPEDIVRSGIVKRYIQTRVKLGIDE